MRTIGTVVRGIRTPIIKDGDDLATIVVDSLMNSKEKSSLHSTLIQKETTLINQLFYLLNFH